MGGLIANLTAGALGGAGKGISENAQSDMKFNYEQMSAQLRDDMAQRVYERGRRDKASDDAAAYERDKGLINLRANANPQDNELRAAQAETARFNLDKEKQIKALREKLAQAENLARNDPSLMPLVEERKKKLATLLGSKPDESYSVREEFNPDTNERKQITEVKGTGKPAAAAADKFIVGKQYKDASGNVATYRGNGQWE